MSEYLQPTAEEQEDITPLTHRRILIVMAMVAIFGSLLGFAFISGLFGLGVLIGGVLSFVNYYWLKYSLKKIFEQAVDGEKARFLGLRYLFRYFVLGGILLIVFLTKTVPVAAVILGLASFALAVMIEALIRLFAAFFKKKEVL